ncbi:hypothetical protein GCM10010371_67270 [Streptomyces subrutilus]|uniref:Uncharacterized protein n=1 Tax=Streptomyces subrutilus TaxID=36818 RepID=A0A5P2USF5_9ACTN|nr:hypothetical protein [Streptomyces subrutilus]QEU82276.1 hypothetical protein CP968_31980 [Streptomyces subrutilus]GGZ98099.1 hypothetical protein GCM10010371_67270 [Streptomyces subrutilus]
MALFDLMADRWHGENPVNEAAIMVRTLAPRIAQPADWNRSRAYAEPVLRFLKEHSHQWISVRQIGESCSIPDRRTVELVMCLNALVDAGHLVEGPATHYAYGIPNTLGRIDHIDARRDAAGRHSLPLPPEIAQTLIPGGARDQALDLIPTLHAHFAKNSAGYRPTWIEICLELGLDEHKDGMILYFALGAMAAHGHLRMLPSADVRGPRWELPPTA